MTRLRTARASATGALLTEQPLVVRSPARGSLDRAVLSTLAYADVFDYPLSVHETHRYLVELAADVQQVEHALTRMARTTGAVCTRGGWWMLADRPYLTDVRCERAAHAIRLWPLARRYGAMLARLPFVRLVGVSGALAVDNVSADADIDYFIVTEPGRLWTARALVVALVRLARRRGHLLCPNYLVTEQALVLSDRNVFSAHELMQMVPLAGRTTYARMRRENAWAFDYLPNAAGPPACATAEEYAVRHPVWQRLAERAGRSIPGRWFERWERERKLRRLRALPSGSCEASFGADWCKGHFGQHKQRVLAAYSAGLARLDGFAS